MTLEDHYFHHSFLVFFSFFLSVFYSSHRMNAQIKIYMAKVVWSTQ